MNISIDGGALCSNLQNRFGNYTFSENLLKAVALYDKKNIYHIYTFCDKRIIQSENIFYHNLQPKLFWSTLRISLEELINPKDIFFALNQSIPLYRRGKVISFSHGLSFHYFPQYYKLSYKELSNQLKSVLKYSDKIVVSSKKVKKELLDINSNIKNIIVIPFGIPFDMLSDIPSKPIKRKKTFLFVGMNNKIKNIDFLIKCFKKFIKNIKYKDYKLVLIGDHKQYNDNENIICVKSLTRKELKNLYSKTSAYLTSSYYESFNLPVLEALSQECPVIGLKSAIIPELEKYVLLSSNEKEFVDNMIYTIERNCKKIDIKLLKQEFSWKRYIEQLTQL